MAGHGMVEIRVLGPVELGGATEELPLTAEKQRRLLAALVARAGEACSTDRLIDAVWGASPPASADKLLQVYISQLRKLLQPASIRRRGASYALELNGSSVDTIRFERLLGEGKAALRAGNPALAVSLLRRGLALWRGPAYGEFAYEEFARGEAERLEELRLAALEARFEAELVLGRHADLVPELRALAAEHPFRERLQAQAMLALYRSGRQSEALDIYRALNTRLREGLGLEPSLELRELHRRILQHDRELDTAQGAPAAHTLPAPPSWSSRPCANLLACCRPSRARSGYRSRQARISNRWPPPFGPASCCSSSTTQSTCATPGHSSSTYLRRRRD